MARRIVSSGGLVRLRHAAVGLLAAVVLCAARVPEAAAASLVVLPGQSVQAAVDAAAPGDIVYLVGAHREDVTIGRSRITLASAPGQQASLQGRLIVWDGADDVVVTGLRLDGRNEAGAPSPTVLGDRAVFRGNDVTNANTETCFILGSLARGYVAEGTLIEENRIHDCGKLPARNGDHGIYLEYARDTVITRNYIYDNADRGIQLYPDADRTLIERNVIDGNGEGIIFSGLGGLSSDHNVVRNNVISNSRIRFNVEYYYGPGTSPGVGNVVARNCVWGGKQGNILGAGIAFAATGNVVAEPRFAARSAKDFRLPAGARCASALEAELR